MKPHFTTALRAGDFVFVSGQLPFDENGEIVAGGIAAQTRQCLENIRQALKSVNLGLTEVVRVGVFNTVVGDKFLRFEPETRSLQVLARQPQSRFRGMADDLYDAREGARGAGIATGGGCGCN